MYEFGHACHLYLEGWASTYNFEGYEYPGYGHLQHALQVARHAAPGLDGLPADACLVGIELSMNTLYQIMLAMTFSSQVPPIEFNMSIQKVPPKGDQP